MPELPDLQVFAGNLEHRLAGRKLERIVLSERAKANVKHAELEGVLVGKQLAHVTREGKELRFDFGAGASLQVHLMLHGKFEWIEEEGAAKHTLAEFWFDAPPHLALADYQRAAKLTLNPTRTKVPDALEVDADFWQRALQKSKTNIKALLVDQKVVRGIGNAYADEILWEARVAPASVSNKIPPAAVRDLARAVKSVLTSAEEHIRAARPDAIGGELRDFLPIHNSKKKESPGGASIQRASVGGRKTYFTEEQTLYE